MERRESPSVRITDARTSHSDDLRHRQIRYLLSMLVRTLCFVGAVIVDGWLRWVLVVAALFLPYIAVVMANAVSRKPPERAESFSPEARGALGSSPSQNVDHADPA
jgi:Protein of unknown function (DUF3099)